MKTFTGTDISTDIRQILNDTDETDYIFEDSEIVVNINKALRALFRDVPAASYSTPVAFTDEVSISELSDTISVDKLYKDAIIHYASAQCFYQNRRDTANIERGNEEMKKYRQAI